jgi:hypothetical protein
MILIFREKMCNKLNLDNEAIIMADNDINEMLF